MFVYLNTHRGLLYVDPDKIDVIHVHQYDRNEVSISFTINDTEYHCYIDVLIRLSGMFHLRCVNGRDLYVKVENIDMVESIDDSRSIIHMKSGQSYTVWGSSADIVNDMLMLNRLPVQPVREAEDNVETDNTDDPVDAF